MAEMKVENKPFVLPKNIRQMGTPGELQKVYVEDYVHTYLHSFLKEKYKEDTLRVALLLGAYVSQEETTYAFIKGAVACDFSHLHEEISEDLSNAMASFFPEWDMLGWYVCAQGVDAHIQSEIKHYYAARAEQRPQYLIYEDELEMETDVFVWEQNALHKLKGYYIYYERNPQMQEFLIHEKGGRPQETPSFSGASVLGDKEMRYLDDAEGQQSYLAEPRTSYVRDEPSIHYRRKSERQIKAVAAREVAEMAEESRWNNSRKMAESRYRGGAAEEQTNRAELKKQLRQQTVHKPRPSFAQKMAYAACAIVLILLAAMGISQFDNYQSIRNLQEAISSTLLPVREHAVEQDKDVEEALPTEETVEGEEQSTKQDEQERIPTDLNENNRAQGAGQTNTQAQPEKTQTSTERSAKYEYDL